MSSAHHMIKQTQNTNWKSEVWHCNDYFKAYVGYACPFCSNLKINKRSFWNITPSDLYILILSQQTRDTDPILVQCWPAVCDVGPTLNQSWVIVSCSTRSPSKHWETDRQTDGHTYILVRCLTSFVDDGLTLNQHWVNASYFYRIKC